MTAPVIRDGRFFDRSNTGWSIQLGRYRLSWGSLHGGWSLGFHKLITDKTK